MPTLDEVIALIREETRTRRAIEPGTRIEGDLGVTGDDANDLLMAAERCFDFSWSSMNESELREVFGLRPDEYLFGPEGFELFSFLLPRRTYKDLTIKEFHQAICRAKGAAISS